MKERSIFKERNQNNKIKSLLIFALILCGYLWLCLSSGFSQLSDIVNHNTAIVFSLVTLLSFYISGREASDYEFVITKIKFAYKLSVLSLLCVISLCLLDNQGAIVLFGYGLKLLIVLLAMITACLIDIFWFTLASKLADARRSDISTHH